MGKSARTDTKLMGAARLMPDVVRLLRRLATDRDVPRSVRVRIWLVAGYLALPIDLIPDFVPVIGYADDVLLVAGVLRSAIRRAGPDVIARHWPGTPEGLAVLKRIAGIGRTSSGRPELF